MKANEFSILVITPIEHINNVQETLESTGKVTYLPDPTYNEVLTIIQHYDAIFTNPNKSNVYIGKELIDSAKKLKVICTASTGTNHIDKKYAKQKEITIISLTEERETINKISSTAELAFAIMLSALRNIPSSFDSVKNGEWDYERFIGRQMDYLTIGVVGFGRLGQYFAKYAKAFGSRVLIYDPYKKVKCDDYYQVGLNQFLSESDVISLHVHVTKETTGMVDASWMSEMKKDVLIVNSARGDVCNERDLIDFLKCNPKAKYATDVLANETQSKSDHPVINYASESSQILVTPHIGGMTTEGQMIAYNHAASLLKNYFGAIKNA